MAGRGLSRPGDHTVRCIITGGYDVRIKSGAALAAWLLFLGAVGGASAGEPVFFARTPEISPDGKTIAFSYVGDIWVVDAKGGDARRLTDHVAYDGWPVWSPDGSEIAFASDREGNFDVYVVAVEGGDPVRITFHSNTDIPSDWTPDGEMILFESRRGGSEDLWLASRRGGTPVRISGVFLEREAFADLSSDGTKLLYNDNRCTTGWWRRNMHSSDAAEIHIADFGTNGIEPKRLTRNEVHDLWPHFSADGNMIYYASGDGEPRGIWRMPVTGGAAVREVLGADDVTWLSLSSATETMVWTSGFDVWFKRLGIGEPERVEIHCATEPKESVVEPEVYRAGATEYRVSPDGKKVVFAVHGELFVVPAGEGGKARRITNTPWREGQVRWLSDSRRVVYTSDRNGALDLFVCDTRDVEEKPLTSGEANDSRPLPSPDGKWIAFYRGNESIMLLPVDGGEPRLLAAGRFLDLRLEDHMEFSWSPDSKWLAYTAYAEDFHTDIRVHNVEDDTDEAVSFLAGWNYRPIWSVDGEEIYFTSRFNKSADTYRIRLREKKPRFEEDLLDSLYDSAGKENKEEKGNGEGKRDDEVKPVKIDFDRIDLRAQAFPNLANDENGPVLSEDGKLLIFSANVLGNGKFDLWSFPVDDDSDDKKLNQLTTTSSAKTDLQVAGADVWYLEGGKIRSVGVEGGKGKTLSFEADMEVDHDAERRQMFLEGWSILKDQFYDIDYHGVNWNRVKGKYARVLPYVRTRGDFQTFMRMMIGELDASHLDFRPSESAHRDFTGELGVDLDYPLLASGGGFRVASVLPDSPADLDESRIEPGEYLISVDGVPLTDETNLFALLERKVGDRVTIEVASDRDGRRGRTVEIKPVTRPVITRLKYRAWVNERRAMVDKWSGGRLAYLHIRGMGAADLVRFRKELVTMADKKEGAVIDVRYNGGGSVAVHILGILERRPFLMRNFRGTPVTSETKMRSYGYEKPTSLLINNHSYSNAEIFAEGFRRLGLGPIVGIPTAGAVIGTSQVKLLDGSTFRKPSWGAFTVDGENLENNGREPDFYVENSYSDWMAGDDPQLRKAVEELLKSLDTKVK